MKRKLTEKDFNIFTEEVYYWVAKLGIISSSVYVRKDFVDQSNRGTVDRHRPTSARIFTIYLCMNAISLSGDNYLLRMNAFHEVFEILMHDIFDTIQLSEGAHYGQTCTHEIIRTLENTFFTDDYNRRFNTNKKTL